MLENLLYLLKQKIHFIMLKLSYFLFSLKLWTSKISSEWFTTKFLSGLVDFLDFIHWHVNYHNMWYDYTSSLSLRYMFRTLHDILFCLSGGHSTFSLGDILEMNAEVSNLPEFAVVESGPLILAWAVFLCLVLSLPGSNTNLVIMIFNLIDWYYFNPITAGEYCILLINALRKLIIHLMPNGPLSLHRSIIY